VPPPPAPRTGGPSAAIAPDGNRRNWGILREWRLGKITDPHRPQVAPFPQNDPPLRGFKAPNRDQNRHARIRATLQHLRVLAPAGGMLPGPKR